MRECKGIIRRVLWRLLRGNLPDRPLGSEEPWAHGTIAGAELQNTAFVAQSKGLVEDLDKGQKERDKGERGPKGG